jgi:hypothetical protein
VELIWQNFKGLLDLYPNAAVAYSLRRLRADYTGSAIRVRRSSDSAEQDIGFVSNVLDTASLLTFVGAGDGFVTTWYDQSGLGLNATQTTAGVQPFIVLAGVLQLLNGKPSVRFVDDSGAAVLDRLNVPLFHLNTVPYLAYFATYSLVTAGNFPFIIGGADSDRGLEWLHGASNRTIAPVSIRVGGNSQQLSTAINLNQQYIATLTANRVRLIAYLNNQIQSNIADRNANFIMPSPTYYLGNLGVAAVQNNNLIQEFVAYARDVEAEISGINTNTNTFYGAY